MLGKVLSMVLGGANNPWKPKSQEQFDAMVADKDKIGNYVEYAGKTYRIEAAHFEGAFKVGETYRTVYFDTTKTPYSYVGASDETTVFVEGINKTLGIKYLMVDDNRCSEDFFTIKLKRGLVYAYYTDGTGRAIIGVDKNGYSAVYDDGLVAYSNKWYTENMGEGGSVSFEEDFTPTMVLSSLYTWNSYIAYPKFVPQYARRYYPLSALSTPASASDIKKGKQAYDETGSRITGTHEEPQNPWAPATEAEYKKLLVPSNVGNFFDYDNKITRLKNLSVSDSLALGDSITGLYFDTTKTPTVPDFSSGYEEGNEMRLKYLFKTSTMSEGPVPYCGLFWYYAEDAGKTFIALAYAASNGSIKYVYGAPEADSEMTWLLSMNEGGDPTGFTLSTAETITSLNSDTNWNGVYVFKNKVVDVAEYAEVGGETTGAYTVKVIDYDGTVLLEQKGNAGDVIELPTAPTHDRLVFQEWSASVAVSNNKVTIADNDIMVGAVYTTTSGKNEFDITLTKVTGLSVTLNMDGTKDWGDGTSDTETTHTYTAYGDYTILCDGTKMTTSSSAGLFGQSSNANNDYCTRLRFAGVTSIGSYACYKCYSLTSITIPNSVTSIGDYAYYYCYSLTSVTIPKGVTSIGANAFVGTFLTDITIPNSVTSIGDYAFVGTSLTNITIPNSVTSIGDYAFRSCRSLTSITIPSSVTSIRSSAFRDCYSLTSITIPSSVTSIRDYACFNCCSLTDITIPNGVKSIGASAFKDCYSLTNITIPNSVTSIESDAFSGCRSLTSITIPSSVKSIRGYAFGFCSSLTRCDFSRHTSVPTLVNTGTFANINAICKIIVPDNLYDRWIAASNWSTYADYIYKASEVQN